MTHFVEGHQRDRDTLPVVGDTVTYSKTKGYVVNRPYDCRHSCQCGKCNGVTEHFTGKVTRVACFMDNSTEVYTEHGHRLMWIYPHGDACY